MIQISRSGVRDPTLGIQKESLDLKLGNQRERQIQTRENQIFAEIHFFRLRSRSWSRSIVLLSETTGIGS